MLADSRITFEEPRIDDYLVRIQQSTNFIKISTVINSKIAKTESASIFKTATEVCVIIYLPKKKCVTISFEVLTTITCADEDAFQVYSNLFDISKYIFVMALPVKNKRTCTKNDVVT